VVRDTIGWSWEMLFARNLFGKVCLGFIIFWLGGETKFLLLFDDVIFIWIPRNKRTFEKL
jgi:hypothetical protein